MTADELRKRFPWASECFIKANADEYKLVQKESKRTQYTCLTCGKIFEFWKCQTRKYCSLSCAYKSKDRVAHMVKKDRGTAFCKNCGLEFRLRTNGGIKFCCRRCASSYIGKTVLQEKRMIQPVHHIVEIECEQCGRTFKAPRSSNRVYCSMECTAISVPKKSYTTMMNNGFYTSPQMYSRTKRGWRIIGGRRIWFRSRMEANFARYLEFSGKEWAYEPKTFWFKGIKRGVLSYTPDFYLPQEDKYIETKGWMDKKSITKLKRMKKYHPAICVELVDWKHYRAISKTVRPLIKDWERD